MWLPVLLSVEPELVVEVCLGTGAKGGANIRRYSIERSRCRQRLLTAFPKHIDK